MLLGSKTNNNILLSIAITVQLNKLPQYGTQNNVIPHEELGSGSCEIQNGDNSRIGVISDLGLDKQTQFYCDPSEYVSEWMAP